MRCRWVTEDKHTFFAEYVSATNMIVTGDAENEDGDKCEMSLKEAKEHMDVLHNAIVAAEAAAAAKAKLIGDPKS